MHFHVQRLFLAVQRSIRGSPPDCGTSHAGVIFRFRDPGVSALDAMGEHRLRFMRYLEKHSVHVVTQRYIAATHMLTCISYFRLVC